MFVILLFGCPPVLDARGRRPVRPPLCTPLVLVKLTHLYSCKHGRNFVEKCGGSTRGETNIVIWSMQKWRFI